MIDETGLARRKAIESRAIRAVVLGLVLLGTVTIVASLRTGRLLFQGPLFVEREYAGEPVFTLAIVIGLLLLPLVWVRPRPRSVVGWGCALWLLAVGLVVTMIGNNHTHHDQSDPLTALYRSVDYDGAQLLAMTLTWIMLWVAWVIVPIIATIYGLVFAISDEHRRRQLPDAPEFPRARVV